MEDERQSGREHNICGGGTILNRIFFFFCNKKKGTNNSHENYDMRKVGKFFRDL